MNSFFVMRRALVLDRLGWYRLESEPGACFTNVVRCILYLKQGRKMIFAKKLRFMKGSQMYDASYI